VKLVRASGGVTRAKVSSLVHRDGTAISDAGADAVGALDSLRPHPAKPDTPIAELARARLPGAMLDGDTLGVAKQRDVACDIFRGLILAY
jgi:hypothetical protein